MVQDHRTISSSSLLRLWQIVGNPKVDPPIPPLIPVSRSTWWNWVKQGRAPSPIKLGPRTTCWRAVEVIAFIELSNNTPEKHLDEDSSSVVRKATTPERKRGVAE